MLTHLLTQPYATSEEASDSFEGDDGDSIDPTKWFIREGSPEINGNRLKTHYNAGQSSAAGRERVISKYQLIGDFEVIHGLSLGVTTGSVGGGIDLRLLWNLPTDRSYLSRTTCGVNLSGSTVQFYNRAAILRHDVVASHVPFTAAWGEDFKIVRSGNQMIWYLAVGGSWTQVHTETDAGYDYPVLAEFENWSYSTFPERDYFVDYISMDADSIIKYTGGLL